MVLLEQGQELEQVAVSVVGPSYLAPSRLLADCYVEQAELEVERMQTLWREMPLGLMS